MHIQLLRVSVLFSILAGNGLLGGADMFVSPTGTGSACTQGAPCSLATALTSASPGAVVYMASGTYTYPGSGLAVASITKSMTLNGGWDGTTSQPPVRDPETYVTTIDGQNRYRGVIIAGPANVTLDGMSLAHGNNSGDGSNSGLGGGLHANSATLTVRNCIIRKNLGSSKSGASGGGIFLGDCRTTIDACTIDGNVGTSASGITLGGAGGGAYAYHGSLVVRGCTITNNMSAKNYQGSGGGIFLNSMASATIENNIIRGNSGSRAAWASDGGGIYVGWSKKVSIAGNRIERNWTSKHPTDGLGAGGGIYVSGSAAVISGNWVLRNSCGRQAAALRPGGGVAVYSNLPVTLVNNIIARNEGGGNGDGVYVAPYSSPAAKTTLLQNTICDNKTNGVVVSAYGRVVMKNNIVSGHSEGVNNISTEGATLSADHNLIWNDTDPITGKNAVTEDPLLTSDYHLTADSPAIGAGMEAGVTVDIDGQVRGSPPDIGAYEYVPASATAAADTPDCSVDPR